jgi:hypothetical protein
MDDELDKELRRQRTRERQRIVINVRSSCDNLLVVGQTVLCRHLCLAATDRTGSALSPNPKLSLQHNSPWVLVSHYFRFGVNRHNRKSSNLRFF